MQYAIEDGWGVEYNTIESCWFYQAIEHNKYNFYYVETLRVEVHLMDRALSLSNIITSKGKELNYKI